MALQAAMTVTAWSVVFSKALALGYPSAATSCNCSLTSSVQARGWRPLHVPKAFELAPFLNN